MSQGAARVLIVDDDAEIRKMMTAILRRESYAVDVAADGFDAIEMLRDDTGYDAVLLDLMMPRVDGVGVYTYIAENAPALTDRVIVMTAFPREAALRLGFACPVVSKPFDMQEMMTTIRECATATSTPPAAQTLA